jgi:hypothetical protein
MYLMTSNAKTSTKNNKLHFVITTIIIKLVEWLGFCRDRGLVKID